MNTVIDHNHMKPADHQWYVSNHWSPITWNQQLIISDMNPIVDHQSYETGSGSSVILTQLLITNHMKPSDHQWYISNHWSPIISNQQLIIRDMNPFLDHQSYDSILCLLSTTMLIIGTLKLPLTPCSSPVRVRYGVTCEFQVRPRFTLCHCSAVCNMI